MVKLTYKDKKSDNTVGSTIESNNQNKNLYKLEIHKVMGKEMLNKKYKDDRQGLHYLHCDIISFTKSNNMPMEYSDIILDKIDNLNPGDYEVVRIAEFMVRISRTLRALTAKEVIDQIKKAETNRQEWHGRIYEDSCWWADIERHPYGQIRFWVGFEDKRSGKSRASIVTLDYLNNNGDLRYCTDGIQIKQVVWNKIQSTAKALIKAGILKL